MRILYIIDHMGIGGAQKRLAFTSLYLKKKGHETELCILNPDKGIFFNQIKETASNIYLIPVRKNVIKAYLRLRKIIADGSYDIIHTHLFYAFLAGTLLKPKCSTKLVVHINHEKEQMPFFYFPLYRFLQHRVDMYLSINNSVFKDMIRYGIREEKIVRGTIAISAKRLSCQIDRLAFKESLGFLPQDHIILRVARLCSDKRHEEFFKAMYYLKKDIPSVRLLEVGAGPKEKRFRKLVSKLGLAEHVFFLGKRHDIAKLNAIADIAFGMGMGTYSVEHMFCGVPVFSYDWYGPEEIINNWDNGVIVPRGQHQQIAEAVKKVLKDPKLLNHIRQQAKATINGKHTFKYEANIWNGVYQRLKFHQIKLGVCKMSLSSEAINA